MISRNQKRRTIVDTHWLPGRETLFAAVLFAFSSRCLFSYGPRRHTYYNTSNWFVLPLGKRILLFLMNSHIWNSFFPHPIMVRLLAITKKCNAQIYFYGVPDGEQPRSIWWIIWPHKYLSSPFHLICATDLWGFRKIYTACGHTVSQQSIAGKSLI